MADGPQRQPGWQFWTQNLTRWDGYLSPDTPQLFAEQHALFRRNPGTRFIAAHLGWLGNDLARLGKLVRLAEETRLYLDVTGLGCYHKQDVPAWYDALEESARWEVQARFWRAVASSGRWRP